MSVDPERKRLTDAQLDLVREVIQQRAPHLMGLVDEVADGHVISEADMDKLSDVITYVVSEETDRRGEYTERGLALDDLIGILWMWHENY